MAARNLCTKYCGKNHHLMAPQEGSPQKSGIHNTQNSHCVPTPFKEHSAGTSGTAEFGRPQPSTRALISAYRNNVAYRFLDKYMVSVRMSSERLEPVQHPIKQLHVCIRGARK